LISEIEAILFEKVTFYFFADLCHVVSVPSIFPEVSLPLGRIILRGKFDMRHDFYLRAVISKEEEKL